MKRLIKQRTKLFFAFLLLFNQTPVHSDLETKPSVSKQTLEAIEQFKEENPWLTKNYCMKKGLYEYPVGHKRWEKCSMIMLPSLSYLLTADLNNFNNQSELIKLMKNDSRYAWYNSIKIYTSYTLKNKKKELIGLGLRMDSQTLNQLRILQCNHYRKNNYYKLNEGHEPPLKAYCLSIGA